MLSSFLFRPGNQVGPKPDNKNHSFLVLGAAKVADMGWHNGKATGFEATRPDVCSLTSTAVVITENPDVVIYHAVKLHWSESQKTWVLSLLLLDVWPWARQAGSMSLG